MNFKTLNNIAGWLTFAVAAVVLSAAAQPTGSLWDCGEFVSGAYKLQVVHPPGAPIFLLVGRLFAWVGSIVSSNPSTIAYSVNLLSALCTAFAALFVCWSTTILARLVLVGRANDPVGGQAVAVVAAGVVAGLSTAFCTSVWFSAVEGEVYAMSTFFTCMTLWAALKWYNLPDTADADRWLIFAMYSVALSIGVHLLSLLTFPALALLYYFKKSKDPNPWGAIGALLIGALLIFLLQSVVITGIPEIWSAYDRLLVNSFGLPFNSGLFPLFLILGGIVWFGLRVSMRPAGSGLGVLEIVLASVVTLLVAIAFAYNTQSAGAGFAKIIKTVIVYGLGIFLLIAKMPRGMAQRFSVGLGVVILAYMSYGMVVIRANANTPINMNNPSDAARLLPYLNREQYGERPLFNGPNFDAKPIDVSSEPRYGRVGDHYEIVDEKTDYKFDPAGNTLFPRMGDYSQGRPALYRRWIDKEKSRAPITLGDNLNFFWNYQIKWMYWRYFMWNFSGRQNGEQGYYSWDPSSGNWITGFDVLDQGRIGNQAELPDFQKNNQANNKYYLIPFLLGIFGAVFHAMRRPKDFIALLVLFFMTGLAIILYSNQPPNEPRERDYVLVGSFFTFTIWIGMGVIALFEVFTKNLRLPGIAGAGIATLIGISAPLLMVTQNWDDHSRAKQYASRDYARNFLESCAPNAIIFTYGDNDTYPLWYSQEVEGIRTDIRVVNLSLIAVDWYIDQLRRATNNSPAIKLSIGADKIRGFKRVQTPFYDERSGGKEMTIQEVVKFLSEDHPLPARSGRGFDTYLPTSKISIPVNRAEALKSGAIMPSDTAVLDTIHFELPLDKDNPALIKDEMAILDLIASNVWERPIYWAVTCREEKLLGLEDYLQLEGLGLRLVPIRTDSKDAMTNFGIIGAGRVASDLAFNNIMEKWQWGNFDKERQFIDRSYMPSLQTMRMTFIRVGRQLAIEGKKDKAVALTDKYFEAFPQYNFQYDQFTALMTDVYAQAGAKEKAAAKIREIATTMEQQFRFIESQPKNLQGQYAQDLQMARSTTANLLNTAQKMGDEALLKELEERLGKNLPQAPSQPIGQ